MLKKIVTAIEMFAVVAFAFWAVMLFANEPANADLSPEQELGKSVYADNCARCHSGDGGGGIGPAIGGYNSERQFPEVADQIALVQNGRGGMPAWEGTLSDEEIAAVVDYTRNVLTQ